MDLFTEAMREPAVDRAAVADLNEKVLYKWRHIAAAIDEYLKLCKVSSSSFPSIPRPLTATFGRCTKE